MAEQIRVGLEQKGTPVLRVIKGTNPLDQFFHGRKVREHIRDFGALFALIFTVISGFILYRGGSEQKALSFLFAGAVLFVLAVRAPKVLRPVWSAWMKLAEKLSVVMTFVILMVAWCTLVIPMAMVLRVLRVQVMDMNFRMPVSSYWDVRPDKLHDFKLLERQF